MADGAHDSPTTAEDMESLIKSAIVARTTYFQDQADSLTFEGVRRLLEKDLGLETHALDSHKRFVKQWLQNSIESPSADNLPKSEGTTGESAVSSTERKSVNEPKVKKEEGSNSRGGEMMEAEDSPVKGLMTGSKTGKENSNGTEERKSKVAPSEGRIKKAVGDRASYIRENSETITLAGVRRLLEEDLTLEKHTLDPLKKFIGQQVDEVLNPPESPPKKAVDKKKTGKKENVKASSKSKKEEAPTTSGEESDEGSEEEVNVRKKTAPSAKLKKSAPVTKRKKAEEDSRGAKKPKITASKSVSEASDKEDNDGVSGDDNSESSAEKPVKKKEVPKPSYGKEVERLKSVIKSCGLSIAPVIYRKVKDVPENKREACLIKELEKILSNEGLSTNPSEKDIKDVKKRKEKAKELEGIDLSNIVVSSRRRSAATYVPPPKPKIPELSESESEDSENDDEEDDDDEEEVVEDEEVEDEEAAGEDEEVEDDEAAGEDEEAEDDDEEVKDEDAASQDQENGGDDGPSQESDQDKNDSD